MDEASFTYIDKSYLIRNRTKTIAKLGTPKSYTSMALNQRTKPDKFFRELESTQGRHALVNLYLAVQILHLKTENLSKSTLTKFLIIHQWINQNKK